MQTAPVPNQGDLAGSSIELDFPVLSFDTIVDYNPPDIPSSNMAPASEGYSDDTGSSLGDSAYEILGDSTVLTSDDEDCDDTADSVLSIGVNGSDDITSLAGSEDGGATPSTSSQAESENGEPAPDAEDFTAFEDVHKSDMTIKGKDEWFPPGFRLNERPGPYSGHIEATYPLPKSSEEQTAMMLNLFGIGRSVCSMVGNVKQTMTNHCIPVTNELRVLYIGNCSAKDGIAAKLAACLACQVPPCSSSHTYQQSSWFESTASKKGDPKDCACIDLIIDTCSLGGTSQQIGRPNDLSLRINNAIWLTSKWSGKGYEQKSPRPWVRPDLAVFFVSEDDDSSAQKTRKCAAGYVRRHHIPSITVSQAPHGEISLDAYTSGPHAVHTCIEITDSKDEGHTHIQRLPVDLSTFLKVDAGQLNRNIAFLMDHWAQRAKLCRRRRRFAVYGMKVNLERMKEIEDHLETAHNLAARPEPSCRPKKQQWQALLLLYMLLLCALAGVTSTLLYQKFGRTSWSMQEYHQIQRLRSFTGISSVPPAAVAVPSPTLSAKSKIRIETSKTTPTSDSKSLTTLSPAKDLSSLMTDPSLMTVNQSDSFKIQTVGDTHIIIRPPKRLSVFKKPSGLLVKVERHGRVLDVELSKLFEGVYAVRLQREDAWGLLNVTVSARSKQPLEQTMQVDFGTSWLRFATWRELAKHFPKKLQSNLGKAHAMVQSSVGQISHDMHALVDHVLETTLPIQPTAQRLRTIRSQLTASKPLSAFRSRQIVTLYQSNPFVRVQDYLTYMHQLRDKASKTFTVARAQKQAYRLWHRMAGQCRHRFSNTAVGWRKTSVEKQARACCKKNRR